MTATTTDAMADGTTQFTRPCRHASRHTPCHPSRSFASLCLP